MAENRSNHPCIAAPLACAQRCRDVLQKREWLDLTLKIHKDNTHLYFPLTHDAPQTLAGLPPGCKRVTHAFEAKPARGGLKERLLALGSINKEEAEELVGSFDIIGDIAILLIRPTLQLKKKIIAQAVLDTHPNVQTVLEKTGGREGEWRATALAFLAGKNTTVTTHRESGVAMKLDVKTCYFSPRLSTERLRLSALIKPDVKEHVVVPFAGVGPFVLVIAKAHPDATVAGVELNPDAAKYFTENIALNKLKNAFAVEGDAKTVLANKKFCGCANRVIAPLPHSAREFLPEMIGALKPGGVLHYYGFAPTAKAFNRDHPDAPAERRFDTLIEEVVSAAKALGRKVTIERVKPVRPYSAAQDQIALDVRVN